MAGQTQALTASNIKYLLVLYELRPGNSGTRCVRIAEMLGVTKPSVHTMINTLKGMGLVRKDLYGVVSFTESGLKLTERYSGYFELISSYFSRILPDKADVRAAACAIMAELPEESLQCFAANVEASFKAQNECERK